MEDDVEEGLKRNVIAGHPASPERAKIRRQCKPFGPVGLMLESIHMNAATIDEDLEIQQYNQAPIKIIEAPNQHLGPAVPRETAPPDESPADSKTRT